MPPKNIQAVTPWWGGTVSHYETTNHTRYACLLHVANIMDDVVGCVGLGRTLGMYKGKWGAMSSGPAVQRFNSLLASVDEQHTLEIAWDKDT